MITALQINHAYQWKDWNVVRSIDCLYIWNEFSALELANESNGWFRFVINDRLATMYSSGSPEINPNPSEGGSEFCHKVLRACCRVQSAIPPPAILSSPGEAHLKISNWSLQSKKENELTITNVESPNVRFIHDTSICLIMLTCYYYC